MKQIKGVTRSQMSIILDILKKYGNCNFFAYGSRVNGEFSSNSDLDILIQMNKVAPFEIMQNLKKDFDESNLPFIVHVSDINILDSSFLSLIKDTLVQLC